MRVLILFMILTITGCYESSKPREIREATNSFTQLCIDGHAYWYRKDINLDCNSEILAPKMTDEGKPIKCSSKEKEVK